MLPMTSEAAISNACTHRKLVAGHSPTTPCDQDLGSFQIATAKRGQITQVHTPTPTRNNDHPRVNTMGSEYATALDIR